MFCGHLLDGLGPADRKRPVKSLLNGRRLKDDIAAGDERCHLGKTKGLEELAQGIHLDGVSTADVNRSEERDESRHGADLHWLESTQTDCLLLFS